MNSCRRAHGRAAWRAVCSHPDIVRRKCVPVRGLLVRRLKNNQLLADGYCVTGHEDRAPRHLRIQGFARRRWARQRALNDESQDSGTRPSPAPRT